MARFQLRYTNSAINPYLNGLNAKLEELEVQPGHEIRFTTYGFLWQYDVNEVSFRSIVPKGSHQVDHDMSVHGDNS